MFSLPVDKSAEGFDQSLDQSQTADAHLGQSAPLEQILNRCNRCRMGISNRGGNINLLVVQFSDNLRVNS